MQIKRAARSSVFGRGVLGAVRLTVPSLATVLLAWFVPAAAVAAKNVVVLTAFEENVRPAQNLVVRAMLDVFEGAKEPIELFAESLDAGRFPDASNEERMRAFLQDKYAAVPVDVVVAVGPAALTFASRHGAALFPSARVVFSGIRESTFASDTLPSGATGVFGHFDLIETLELAFALQPDASRVVVVAGAGQLDRGWLELARDRLRPYEARIEVTYLAGLPLLQLVDELGRLPSTAIVLFLTIIEDGHGNGLRTAAHYAPFFGASAAPVYSPYEVAIGYGVVGGYVDRFDAMGAQTGRLVLRILGGDNAERVPPQRSERPRFVVDGRQLQRWGLNEARLPAETIVEYREPSVWERYRTQILTVIGVIVLQGAAIVALLVLRVRKRRAEAALRDSEERYRDVVEAQTDLVCRYLPDTTLTFVNEAYCRYFGKSREDIVGRKLIEFVPELERTIALAHVQSLFARPRTEQTERCVLKPDGSFGWQQWVEHAITRGDGSMEVQAVGRDVTQLKLAENEVLQRREQVTHLTRVSILGELSGALAHELNQPLTAILMNVQSAQRLLDMKAIDLAELRSILEDVARDDRRASEVIYRMRGLMKQGKQELELLDINALVTDVLSLARGQLIEHHVNVVTRLSAALPLVHGDRVQLQQVVLNLLVNACDSVSGNSEGDRALSVATRSDDNRVLVSVIDNGLGIPPESIDRVFEPFFTTKRQGLGLGLSICRSIVSAHGGRLVATNNVDRGATFLLALPVGGV